MRLGRTLLCALAVFSLTPALAAAQVQPGETITKPKFAGYAYSKRIIFVEGEVFYIAYTDMYDHAGQLWKVAINHGRYAKKPNPNAPLEYPFARDFLYGFVMVDTQLQHGTRAALPGIGFPNEPGWYVNQGDKMGVGEDWFTIASLIAAGR